MIEHVFALAVRLQIAGRNGMDFTPLVLDDKMLRDPAAASADRFRLLKGVQKSVRNKWVTRVCKCVFK